MISKDYYRILNVRLNFPKNFSPMAKDLILKLLKANSEERLSLEEIQNHPWMLTHSPIRPTITQQVVREALPCTLDPVTEETTEAAAEDPIKPFKENEYKVLSKAEPEEIKEPEVKPMPAPNTYTQQIVNLESELQQTRIENNQIRSQLEEKESELDSVKGKIAELEQVLGKLDVECEEKKKIEKTLKEQLSEKTHKIAELNALQEDENKLYQEYEEIRSKCLEKETELSLLKTEIENMDKLSKEKARQAEELDKEVERLKEEISVTKAKYSKAKSEMQDQLLQLSTEVEILQKELQSKERNSSGGTMENLLSFTQENLELLKRKSRTEADLLKQYQESNERLMEMDNKYTELKLKYERDLAELKRRSEMELREVEARVQVTIEQPSTEDIELLKQRIHDSLNNQYRNKQLYDELEHLKSMISRFEKSIMFAKKQLEVLKYLKEHDEEEIKRQEQEIERYVVEIEEYRKKLG